MRGHPASRWFVAALCLQFVVLGAVQAWRDAPTFDEAYHVATGVTALTRHQLRITPEHPPLASMLAALPALAARVTIPRGASWRSGDSDGYSAEFMRAQVPAKRLHRIIFLARLVPLAEGVAVALLAYALAVSLFGTAEATLAATLWLTFPMVLGLAHLDGVDLPFTLTTLLLSLALLKYVRGPTARAAMAVGLVCGLALTVRLTAFVLLPAAIVAVLYVGRARLARAASHCGLILGAAWAVVWLVYRLASPAPNFRHTALGVSAPPWTRLVLFVPWPREFAFGIEKQASIARALAPGYLLGHSWHGARWWFWPGSMLVKVPATTLLVLTVGLLLWRTLGRRTVREGALVLMLPATAVSAFTILQPLPLGLRYLLPAIALGIVAASPFVRVARSAIGGRVVVLTVVLAQLFWLWDSAPRSLAWTAPPFRPGYQFVADSNLDWGQDLYRLRPWSRVHPDATILYFGTVDPSLVVGARHSARSGGPLATRGRWWAVSASLLTDYFSTPLAWMRAYCPVGIIGDSILLYHFDKPPDQRLRGPAKPPSVCDARFSRVVSQRR